MNLENFRKDYLKVITKSTVDADLRDYVRSVVEDTLTEGVKSKDYNVSKKHNIHAGNYPLILNAVNTQSGKKKLSINMSAKESDLDRMENTLQKVSDNLKKLTKDTLAEGVMKEGRMHAADQPGYGKIGKETAAAVDVMMPGAFIKASMIPKKYKDNLDKIEAALTAAKTKMSKDEYNEFLDGDVDTQEELLSTYDIENLELASEFLNWLMDN